MEMDTRAHRDRQIDTVRMPKETTGCCKNYRKCKSFTVELANGYCMECWDKGLDSRDAIYEARELRKKNHPRRGAVKKSRKRSLQMGGGSTYMIG